MEITNEEKGRLYASYWIRLKSAFRQKFYLETIFIAYDFLEDCTRSILKERSVSKELDKMFVSRKLNKIENIISQNKQILSKCIKSEDILEARNWLDKRNDLIHRMMKNKKSFEDAETIAEESVFLARKWMNASSKYKRLLKKEKKNEK